MGDNFRHAVMLVDWDIEHGGEKIDAIERNRRVQAVELKLRQGATPERIDTRATLRTIRIAVRRPR